MKEALVRIYTCKRSDPNTINLLEFGVFRLVQHKTNKTKGKGKYAYLVDTRRGERRCCLPSRYADEG